MARQRQWYEDVMDVALRATLKEFGFKRKSHTNYVCEHSPERIWFFEIKTWRQSDQFTDITGIFVPEVENIVKRIAPRLGPFDAYMKNPAQFSATVARLIKIENGWDNATWEKNTKSRHWFWGKRYPPSTEKIVPLLRDDHWNLQNAKAILAGKRTARDFVLRSIEHDLNEQERDTLETAEAVGLELDRLWRSHVYEWLQKCNDPRFLANWLDKYVCSQRNVPRHDSCAFTGATAWLLAGDKVSASELLNSLITKNEAIVANPSRAPAEILDYAQSVSDAARKLANEFGIRVE